MIPAPTVDVVVPSWGRSEALVRCLEALLRQSVPPQRVVVVCRATDAASRARAAEWSAATNDVVQPVVVGASGLVAAMRAGVTATTAEVVAFTDDDARPREDWIARMGGWFARADVGAVGGRDVQRGVPADPTKVVGRMAPFGRMSGWHHVGTGAPSDVDVLKGVNLAVRADALVLPKPGVLCDAGTSAHFEVLICRAVQRAGWRVVYDPAIVVDHDVLPRVDSARLGDGADRDVVRAVATNRIVASTVLDRRRLPVQLGYGLAVGTRESPGLARALVALMGREGDVAARLPSSVAGQVAGAGRVMAIRNAVDSCADLRKAG